MQAFCEPGMRAAAKTSSGRTWRSLRRRDASDEEPARAFRQPAPDGAKPLDELRNAFRDLGVRVVAEEAPGFVDVRVGQRHVAGLLGHLVDDGFFPEALLDGGDEVVERRGLAFAEVEDVAERAVVGEAGAQALEDVVDVGVVAPRGAVAELVDRLAFPDRLGEGVDGEVGALARAIDGEEAQARWCAGRRGGCSSSRIARSAIFVAA